jgi:uncharacterized protein (TIGR03083 family)
MEIGEHIAAVRHQGDLLAAAAARTDLDAMIPTCPEWTMRDLVRHVGDVHRWAAAHVAERRAEPIRRVEEVAGPLPDDTGLLDWFLEGHTRLVTVLKTADPDVQCWSFLPAPSPLAFWARRQAHETGMHRVDAEGPGGRITPFEPPLATDGIDEMLFGFLGRTRKEAETDPRGTLSLHASDTEDDWFVRIGDGFVEAERGHADADCAVDGSASDLHLLLWNRRSTDGLDVRGDASVLVLWRDTVQIYWSRAR